MVIAKERIVTLWELDWCSQVVNWFNYGQQPHIQCVIAKSVLSRVTRTYSQKVTSDDCDCVFYLPPKENMLEKMLSANLFLFRRHVLCIWIFPLQSFSKRKYDVSISDDCNTVKLCILSQVFRKENMSISPCPTAPAPRAQFSL